MIRGMVMSTGLLFFPLLRGEALVVFVAPLGVGFGGLEELVSLGGDIGRPKGSLTIGIVLNL